MSIIRFAVSYMLGSGVILLLSACSPYASNAEKEYVNSRNGPLVRIPPPLVKQEFSQYYILPTQSGKPGVDIQPPTSS